MPCKVSAFIATSLDGYIARPDGRIDWLIRTAMPFEEDGGYKAFIATVDTLVMGRNTFEQVVRFDSWPYGALPIVVLTHRPLMIPQALTNTVSVSCETPPALVARLTTLGINHLYVDGGKTIQQFLNARLIDEITITTIPVLLGAGRPLFGELSGDIHLVHLFTRVYSCSLVQSKYRVVRESPVMCMGESH